MRYWLFALIRSQCPAAVLRVHLYALSNNSICHSCFRSHYTRLARRCHYLLIGCDCPISLYSLSSKRWTLFSGTKHSLSQVAYFGVKKSSCSKNPMEIQGCLPKVKKLADLQYDRFRPMSEVLTKVISTEELGGRTDGPNNSRTLVVKRWKT